ncbi:MAG TPA: EthD domain-containing protein [Solirubrobacteraceae bacterium]|nr:EthD domain-containing protein [Solirubrobacteraceae bacterium]
MFKVGWFARFPKGMTAADARRHWKEHHGPDALATTIEGYVQNHVSGPVPAVSGVPEEETYFDGYSCGWWSDRAAFDATMATPEWKALEADGDNVFDMSWLRGMSAALREHTVIDGPSSPFKVLWMVRFKAGLDPQEGHRHWEQVHGPIFKSLEIDRYVQNHVSGPLDDGDPPGFDGFSECWFRDEAQFVRAIESDAWAEAVADGDNFIDFSQLWGAVVEETVFRPVPVASVAV